LEEITKGKPLSVCQIFSLFSLREVPRNNKWLMSMPARTVVMYNYGSKSSTDKSPPHTKTGDDH